MTGKKKRFMLIIVVAVFGLVILFSGCQDRKEADVMGIPDFLVDVDSRRDPVILQLTDTQILDASQQRVPNRISAAQATYYAQDRMDENCFDCIRETVIATKPDLILVTGDLVYGEFDDSGDSLRALIQVMESFEIPWAPVMGNHDGESKMGVDWQCAQLEAAQYCLFRQRTLTGNGNYTVGIRQGDKLQRVFFMLDSNGCGAASEASKANGHTKTSAGFGDDQIAWYTKTAKQIKALSPDTKLTFACHIQPAVFEEAFAKYGFTNNDTEQAPINLDSLAEKADGAFGYLGADLKGAWDEDRAVWNSLKALGVDSILVGHEHCNSASVIYEGVRCQFGQKTGTYDRANYQLRSGRIVGLYPPVPGGSPLIGGTLIPLDRTDGSLKTPYIQLV